MIRFIFHQAIVYPSAHGTYVKAVSFLEHVLSTHRTLMCFFWWTVFIRIIIFWVFSKHFLIPLDILVDTLSVSSRFLIAIYCLLIIVYPPTLRTLQMTYVLSFLQFREKNGVVLITLSKRSKVFFIFAVYLIVWIGCQYSNSVCLLLYCNIRTTVCK